MSDLNFQAAFEDPIVIEPEPEPELELELELEPEPEPEFEPEPELAPAPENLEVIARDVIAGRWGTGEDRKSRLTTSRYDYNTVQAKVNEILDAGSAEYRTYTVQPGDTLTGIAGRLNYIGGWQALHAKNLGVIGDKPNTLREGLVLSL